MTHHPLTTRVDADCVCPLVQVRPPSRDASGSIVPGVFEKRHVVGLCRPVGPPVFQQGHNGRPDTLMGLPIKWVDPTKQVSWPDTNMRGRHDGK